MMFLIQIYLIVVVHINNATTILLMAMEDLFKLMNPLNVGMLLHVFQLINVLLWEDNDF